ncbi:MAG: protease modulator HflK, partial [Pseudomonadota bacterium]
QIELDAEAYAQRVVREARGAASRFEDIYGEYVQAPEVTRQRMYLETMEDVLGTMNKVVIDGDGGGAFPYLNLNELVRDGQRQQNRTPISTTQGVQ